MFIPAHGRFTTRTRLWRFFGRLAGVLCKPPFADFVKKSRIRCKRSLEDFYQRREQQCSRPAAFKNATVRERPGTAVRYNREAMTPFECAAVICNVGTADSSSAIIRDSPSGYNRRGALDV